MENAPVLTQITVALLLRLHTALPPRFRMSARMGARALAYCHIVLPRDPFSLLPAYVRCPTDDLHSLV